MLLIALIALTIEAEAVRRRWVFHSSEAAEMRRLEQGMMGLARKEEAKATEARRRAEELEERARGEQFHEARKISLEIAAMERQAASLYAREAKDNRLSSTKYGRLRRLHERAASHPWLQDGPIDGPQGEKR
jgi:hypothetical protein